MTTIAKKSAKNVTVKNVVTTVNGKIEKSNVSTDLKKANEKFDLNKLLAIGNTSLDSKSGTNKGASIYKEELFTGMTDKERKAARIKLRRRLQNYLDTFFVHKNNKQRIAEVKKDWHSYATQIYKDINLIADSNSDKDKLKLVADFQAAMK